ncbi:vacuolar sorting-associated [Pyrenophora seminiperda CCB06]|uniref:Vacuolar sorting-associated n=1 Tax=Pyrenophora seminiperda CCB06 TaxID=1302712 RepID=A0A3M7M5S5_9PLEO|nr:vacuolar sorting-associated [Pyrenophora seminiperda CCB06]
MQPHLGPLYKLLPILWLSIGSQPVPGATFMESRIAAEVPAETPLLRMNDLSFMSQTSIRATFNHILNTCIRIEGHCNGTLRFPFENVTQANQLVPIVPYLQHGGGQVPLQAFLPSPLPSSSIPSVDITEYPSIADYSANTLFKASDAARDASERHTIPTINIPEEHSSQEQPFGQSPTTPTGVVDSSFEEDKDMKGKKPAIAAASSFFGLYTLSQLYQNVLFDHLTPESERGDEKAWVASSQSWLDRKACGWFGMCGLAHLNKDSWTTQKLNVQGNKLADIEHGANPDLKHFWHDARKIPEDYKPMEEREIPQYVIDHAPLIHLYSGEEYWPGDMGEHLIHTTPHLNYTPMQATSNHPNISNLGELNKWGRFVYLQSDDNFYPLSDPRQYRFLGQYHYVNGPLGPRFKNLGRQEICQGNGECVLKGRPEERSRITRRWEDMLDGEGEEMSEEDARKVFGAEYDSAS